MAAVSPAVIQPCRPGLFLRWWRTFYGTAQGFTFQISVAYSVMVRSLENLPDAATFRIAVRVHASG